MRAGSGPVGAAAAALGWLQDPSELDAAEVAGGLSKERAGVREAAARSLAPLLAWCRLLLEAVGVQGLPSSCLPSPFVTELSQQPESCCQLRALCQREGCGASRPCSSWPWDVSPPRARPPVQPGPCLPWGLFA